MRITKNYCCMDCGGLISKQSVLYGLGRCKKCCGLQMIGIKRPDHSKRMMGEKNSNWKGGLPNCIKCGKPLSAKHCKYCVKCWKKYNIGNKHFSYKGIKIKTCLDCNKPLQKYTDANYCKSCANKGVRNHNFGKAVPPPKFINYNKINFRSLWEANFAKWCDSSGIKWKYEPKTFELVLNNKKVNYIPDFYLPEFDCYIEIKGYWRFNAKDKVNQFLKTYTDINYKLYFKEELQELGIIK